MTPRRQIAITYCLAVPILFGFLIFEIGSLYRLEALQGGIAQGGAVLSECDKLLSAIHDSETAARGYAGSGSDQYRVAYGDASSRASAALTNLDRAAKNDAAMQPKLRSLRDLATRRVAELQRRMDSRASAKAVRGSPAAAAQDASAIAEIDDTAAGLRTDEEARLQQGRAGVELWSSGALPSLRPLQPSVPAAWKLPSSLLAVGSYDGLPRRLRGA